MLSSLRPASRLTYRQICGGATAQIALRFASSSPLIRVGNRGRVAPICAHTFHTSPFSTAAPTTTPSTEDVTYRAEGKYGIISIDIQGAAQNTLNTKLQPAFEANFKKALSDSSVKAIIITSTKKNSFIAGADINMLSACKSAAEAQKISSDAQKMMNMIENSSKPVIAAIDGACLGGGLELALACHRRVATTNPKTKLGLPEVMLGLLPGAGGTQRLPRLIGMQAALDMMLTGKELNAERARKLGLVDCVADPPALMLAAQAVADDLIGKTDFSKRGKKGVVAKVLEETGPGQQFLFDQVTKTLKAKTGGHYPAPFKIAEVARVGLEKGLEAGLEAEARGFGELSQTPQSAALISIYFGKTSLAKNRFGKVEKPATKIGVLGAGLMGAGIAQVTIARDHLAKVILYDANEMGLGRGLKQIYDDFKSAVKRKSISEFTRNSLMSNVIPVISTDDANVRKHFKDADILIEAVPESLALKHKVLGHLEQIVPKNCVIASNTSALPIGDIAKGLTRPDRVLGMHYFSPVPKMPLLEIIKTDATSDSALALAFDVGLKQGKVVILVKDGPGFYTTRILVPMMMEAVTMLQEGVSLEALDSSLKKFGFPVGPVTLVDEVGVDVGFHVSHDLGKAFGARFAASNEAELMQKMMDKGFLGRKSGRGFFVYEKKSVLQNPSVGNILSAAKGLFNKAQMLAQGKSVKREINEAVLAMLPSKKKDMDMTEMNHRMVLRMVNEAVLCLQEGILPNAMEGDIGAIFGLGFPPFLGGPFRYIDQVGAQEIVSLLEKYEKQHGARFTPAALLKDHAKTGKRFHPK